MRLAGLGLRAGGPTVSWRSDLISPLLTQILRQLRLAIEGGSYIRTTRRGDFPSLITTASRERARSARSPTCVQHLPAACPTRPFSTWANFFADCNCEPCNCELDRRSVIIVKWELLIFRTATLMFCASSFAIRPWSWSVMLEGKDAEVVHDVGSIRRKIKAMRTVRFSER